MAKWIKPSRVRAAIDALAEWRRQAKSQAAMHLWPLLAIVAKGANVDTFIEFKEQDDYAFWDQFGRFPGESRPIRVEGEYVENYYIDPLVREAKPSDYPHRGPNTVRTRTFLNSWRCAEVDPEDSTRWKLARNYDDIFVRKVLVRDGSPTRVPLVDLAVWLFREQEFNDTADAKALESKFLEAFPFPAATYDKLFEFVDEPQANVFIDARPTNEEYTAAIRSTIVDPSAPLPSPPEQVGPEATPLLDEDDIVLTQVRTLLAMGSSGIVFRGCPGTSKTWYGKQIALKLTGKESNIFQVQFHPSYGYEDFVEGYRPDSEAVSGFKIADRVFLNACNHARAMSGPVALLIDEINRGDPARIFGEVLTYIEYGYRNQPFRLAYSDREMTVPSNLVVLGTMNTADKSITQLDLALVRRFDFIDLMPSTEILANFLQASPHLSPEQIETITQWFEELQRILPIGHTYLRDVSTPEQLRTVWQYRMLPYCQSVLEIEPQSLEIVAKRFDALFRKLVGKTSGEADE